MNNQIELQRLEKKCYQYRSELARYKKTHNGQTNITLENLIIQLESQIESIKSNNYIKKI